MTRTEAEAFVAAFVKMREGATDAQASTAVDLYPTLKNNGALVKVGTRINWNSTLKRAAVDLWDYETNNPDKAPTLWEDIDYREGYRVISETITAGLAFAKGEIGKSPEALWDKLIAFYAFARIPVGTTFILPYTGCSRIPCPRSSNSFSKLSASLLQFAPEKIHFKGKVLPPSPKD